METQIRHLDMETWDEARWGTGTEQKSGGLNIIQQKTVIQWIKLKNTGSQTQDSDNGIDATWHLICERLWKLSIVFMWCWLFLHIRSTEPNTHLCWSSCYNPKEHHCCERNQKPLWFCTSGITVFVLVLQLSCQLLSHKNYITLWF